MSSDIWLWRRERCGTRRSTLNKIGMLMADPPIRILEPVFERFAGHYVLPSQFKTSPILQGDIGGIGGWLDISYRWPAPFSLPRPYHHCS